MAENDIEAKAIAWVKANTAQLVQRFADPNKFVADDLPATVFMAGSPGAGKTEVSIRLMENFTQPPVRIDADEIKRMIPGYDGQRAYAFQAASSLGVEKLYDHVQRKRLNVVVDGTFAHGKVEENVRRALKRGRKVEIYYLYQDPVKSWEFTRAREKVDYRNIPLDAFVESFFKSRENVNIVKDAFGSKITLNLVVKDYRNQLDRLVLNIQSVDSHIKERYTPDSLRKLIEEE